MKIRTCPHCQAENPASAHLCGWCGRLMQWHDTVPTLLDTVPAPLAPSDLWLDDLRTGSLPPAGAKPTAAQQAPAAKPAPAADPAPAARPAPAAETAGSSAERRAARRAVVRRKRQRALAAVRDGQPEVPEILVVDADSIERGVLCGMLQAFGFATHSTADVAQGGVLLDAHRFTAVFVDIALDAADGGAGIEFARRVRAGPAPAPLFLVSAPLSPIDRVRAQMLGFEDLLEKRVSRGSVARALDQHGIPLPADARRD